MRKVAAFGLVLVTLFAASVALTMAHAYYLYLEKERKGKALIDFQECMTKAVAIADANYSHDRMNNCKLLYEYDSR